MSEFLLVYDGFEPAQEGLREALTSTGNGYFCTRGCAEWEDADGTHYPGTYAHGVYNRRTTVMGIHPVPNEDLVNLPELAGAQAAHRGRRAVPTRQRRAPLLPARIRLPQRAGPARAALPGPSRTGDQPAQPSLREHAPDAPGGDRLGAHGGELVRERRGGVGARRPRGQPGRRSLPPARGSPPRSAGPAGRRRRRDRAEGAHPPVADRGGRGRAHARVSRRRGARGRAHHLPERGLRPAGAGVRAGRGR